MSKITGNYATSTLQAASSAQLPAQVESRAAVQQMGKLVDVMDQGQTAKGTIKLAEFERIRLKAERLVQELPTQNEYFAKMRAEA